MKLFCAVLVTLAAVCRAEPPVNRYLPSKPSSQYGAPSGAGQFSAPSGPSQQYGAPNGGGHGGQTHAVFGGSKPSSNYGAPRPSQNYGAPSSQYLPSNQGYGGNGHGHNDEEYNEPANYNFEYMVKDEHYGTDFGHKESRQGDHAEGQYYVLLPDGRKQIVTYEADEHGYRPKISYEDTGAGYGSGPANGGYAGAGGNGGYAGAGGYQSGGHGGGYQSGGNGGYQSGGHAGGYQSGGNGGYQSGGHGGYQ